MAKSRKKTAEPAVYKPTLLYVADPMCPWSYAFSNIVSQLKGELEDQMKFRMLMGGLRPYYQDPISFGLRSMIIDSWHQVQERTGLPFYYHYFDRHELPFDTEPASRAMVAIRQLKPELEFEIFHYLQDAFFHHNEDIAQEETLVESILKFGISEQDFLELFHSENIERATKNDFDYAQRIGATTLPSLYVIQEGGPELVRHGYAELQIVEEQLKQRVPELSIFSEASAV